MASAAMADADAEVVLGWRATLTLRETPSGRDGTDGDVEVVLGRRAKATLCDGQLAWRATVTLRGVQRPSCVKRPLAAMARMGTRRWCLHGFGRDDGW